MSANTQNHLLHTVSPLQHTHTNTHDMRCAKTDACFFLVFIPISRKCYWFLYFIGLQAFTIPTVHLIDFKLAIFFVSFVAVVVFVGCVRFFASWL